MEENNDKKPEVETVYVNMSGHNKKELVEMITKQKSEGFLGWVVLARDPTKGVVSIEPDEMDAVYQEVKKFEENRRNYAETSFNYYKPAFTQIEQAHQAKDFEAFKNGLEHLLGLIGDD